MTRLASLGATLIGVVLGGLGAAFLLPRADVGPAVAVRPEAELVAGLAEASGLTGVALFVPPDIQPTRVGVWGVPGDPHRPVQVAFEGGLVITQAHRDLLPPEDIGELVSVPEADDAWWQEASDGHRLAVLFGDTLVLLEGLDDDALVDAARRLVPFGAPG